jgi:hypothetical protein
MNNLIKKVVTGVSSVALAASMLIMPVTTHAATAGEVYKTTDGTVWFITSSMQRRPFTSAGAFLSYGFLSFSQVKDADSSVTALPTGSFIAPQDGRIFCATETKGTDVAGECSLVTGGKKAAFTSASVFGGQGYSFSRAFYGDSSFLEKTTNIDNASAQHRPGTLINNNGTVQLVVSGGLWGVPSMDVFNSWGWSFADVVPANSADVLLSQTGVIPARMAGQLVPTATTGTPGTGTGNDGDCDLDGNAGSVTVSSTGTYGAEEVGEGEEDQGVISFDVEADDDSDVAVTSVKVSFTYAGDAGSDEFEDYASEVKVWYGDEEVGSADVEDFNEDGGVYTKSISLDCSEVEAGETGEFSVSVSANDTIDSIDMDDANNDWDAEVVSVRFEDADGVTSTESVSLTESFEFVDFATANDIELKASLTSDEEEINDAHNITIDDTDKTLKEEVLAFTLRASGDSDIWVDEIPVTFTASVGDESTVANRAYLYNGDTLVDSQTITNGGVVVFDDLDMTIDEGDSEDFVVKVDFLADETPTGTFSASLVVDNIDAEDSEGDEVDAADLTGAATSGLHVLTANASELVLDSTESATNNDGTIGTFSFRVTITAEDDDVVVDQAAVDYDVIGGTAPTATVSIVKNSGTTTGTVNDYVVEDGNTATFTITVTVDPDAADSYFVDLNAVDGLITNDEDAVNGPETLTPAV